MARRRSKRRPMTTTEKYQRRVLAGRFLGIELKELKKATKKALKLADKLLRKAREALKAEGMTDIPNVTQLAKEQQRREQLREERIQEAETREPLPYSYDEDETPQIDFSSNVLDEFMATLQEAIAELVAMYSTAPQILDTITKQNSDIITTFTTLKETIGEENLATHITESLEYEALGTITKYSYNGVIEVLDNILTNLQGILNEANEYYSSTSPQTFPNGINFDNL